MRLLTSLALALALLAVGCAGNDDLDAPPEVVRADPADVPTPPVGGDDGPDPADIVSAVGTVRYVDLEGGFFGIETEDARYNPQSLDAEHQIDGLTVRFRARVLEDVMTTQMWGTPIEILEIMPIEGGMEDER